MLFDVLLFDVLLFDVLLFDVLLFDVLLFKDSKTMNLAGIRQLLREGEGLVVEFKEAHYKLPGSLFETVCAFSTCAVAIDGNAQNSFVPVAPPSTAAR